MGHDIMRYAIGLQSGAADSMQSFRTGIREAHGRSSRPGPRDSRSWSRYARIEYGRRVSSAKCLGILPDLEQARMQRLQFDGGKAYPARRILQRQDDVVSVWRPDERSSSKAGSWEGFLP